MEFNKLQLLSLIRSRSVSISLHRVQDERALYNIFVEHIRQQKVIYCCACDKTMNVGKRISSNLRRHCQTKCHRCGLRKTPDKFKKTIRFKCLKANNLNRTHKPLKSVNKLVQHNDTNSKVHIGQLKEDRKSVSEATTNDVPKLVDNLVQPITTEVDNVSLCNMNTTDLEPSLKIDDKSCPLSTDLLCCTIEGPTGEHFANEKLTL